MPLDTGRIAELDMATEHGGEAILSQASAPTLQSGPDIGQALKMLREARGLSLEDVAETTRVRRAYLGAIEDLRLDALPSRPFTIGYIRAYAEALGQSGEAAVERFKSDEPVLEEPLRAPVGVLRDSDPRIAAIIAAVLLVVAAIIVWNIAQRAMSSSGPQPPAAADVGAIPALQPGQTGPVALGAPLPPPMESTTPDLYETPGLALAGEDGAGDLDKAAVAAVQADGALAANARVLVPTFQAKGQVYGGAGTSLVTLQALKAGSLVVRGADGSVYFARQMAAGEAYRAPQVVGLSVDVSEPRNFQVFVAGQSRGLLPAPQASVAELAY